MTENWMQSINWPPQHTSACVRAHEHCEAQKRLVNGAPPLTCSQSQQAQGEHAVGRHCGKRESMTNALPEA